MGGRVGERAGAAIQQKQHSSAPAQAVEHLGETGLVRMRDARARGLDHQRLRVAVERGDDDLLDGVIDRRVGVDHLLEPRRERADQPVGEQHAEKGRSEEHTSELQSLMRISYAVFCLKKKNIIRQHKPSNSNDYKLQRTPYRTP